MAGAIRQDGNPPPPGPTHPPRRNQISYQSFDLLDFGSLTGQFDELDLPYGAGHWDTSLLYETGQITFVPEPATLVLSLAACGLGGYVRRRRKA